MRIVTVLRLTFAAVLCSLAAAPSVQAQGTIFCEPNTAATMPCPCGNVPSGPGRGCNNSLNTGGASLTASGSASLGADTMVLFAASIGTGGPTCANVVTTPLSVLYQADTVTGPSLFGDGVLCSGGNVLLLAARPAVAGTFQFPLTTDPSVSARSAALGDVLAVGASRSYFLAYRDSCPTFCTPSPRNKTNSYLVIWLP
jgi:hypothetical protein